MSNMVYRYTHIHIHSILGETSHTEAGSLERQWRLHKVIPIRKDSAFAAGRPQK